MEQTRLYTESEVLMILSNLVNGIGLCAKGDIMPERYKQKMQINGSDHWVTGRSLKDLLEAYLKLCIKEGTVVPGIVLQANRTPDTPILNEYLDDFYRLYKQKQESLTKENRDRVIRNHIKPRFGFYKIGDITLRDIQIWFNELDADGYSHETLLKIKNVFSPPLDAAVEDGYIPRNPLKSSRLIIGGKETESHKAIPKEKMKEIREDIERVTDVRLRIMLALLGYTGMRLEEILGLRWEDIDFINNWIYIERAVVHPTRNKPEIKEPKTKTSKRRIPLPDPVKRVLVPKYSTGFVLWKVTDQTRETPLSYTEARNVVSKIQKKYNIEGYTAHDFRDTCATEWREAGIPIDIISKLLGHSKSDITEKRYVKYRDELYQGVHAVMSNQNGTD